MNPLQNMLLLPDAELQNIRELFSFIINTSKKQLSAQVSEQFAKNIEDTLNSLIQNGLQLNTGFYKRGPDNYYVIHKNSLVPKLDPPVIATIIGSLSTTLTLILNKLNESRMDAEAYQNILDLAFKLNRSILQIKIQYEKIEMFDIIRIYREESEANQAARIIIDAHPESTLHAVKLKGLDFSQHAYHETPYSAADSTPVSVRNVLSTQINEQNQALLEQREYNARLQEQMLRLRDYQNELSQYATRARSCIDHQRATIVEMHKDKERAFKEARRSSRIKGGLAAFTALVAAGTLTPAILALVGILTIASAVVTGGMVLGCVAVLATIILIAVAIKNRPKAVKPLAEMTGLATLGSPPLQPLISSLKPRLEDQPKPASRLTVADARSGSLFGRSSAMSSPRKPLAQRVTQEGSCLRR